MIVPRDCYCITTKLLCPRGTRGAELVHFGVALSQTEKLAALVPVVQRGYAQVDGEPRGGAVKVLIAQVEEYFVKKITGILGSTTSKAAPNL